MHKRGFTLIELLTVVAIMSILIVAGYPSYQSYLRESRRQDAIQGILTFQITIEDYIAKNNALPDPAISPYTPRASTNNLYTITYSRIDLTALTYNIVAVAIGDQINDKAGATPCSSLTLDNIVDGITPYACK